MKLSSASWIMNFGMNNTKYFRVVCPVDPDVLAAEIIEKLGAALEQFESIKESLFER